MNSDHNSLSMMEKFRIIEKIHNHEPFNYATLTESEIKYHRFRERTNGYLERAQPDHKLDIPKSQYYFTNEQPSSSQSNEQPSSS